MTDTRSVLFVTVDCLRADHTGCYGYDRPTTPAIDRFAADATLFEHSYANAAHTRWAMQALHTGYCPHAIDGLGIPEGATTLAERFQAAGWATGGFANNGFVSREYNYHQGFDRYDGVAEFAATKPLIKRLGDQVDRHLDSRVLRQYVYEPLVETLRSAESDGTEDGYREAVTDRDVVDAACDWIAQRQADGDPHFTWVHLMDAHTPYSRWDDHLEAIRGDTDVEHVVRPHDQITVGEEPPQAAIDAYDAGVRSADEQVGRLLDTVGDGTVVAITADHGESFGRYAPFHAGPVYSSLTQVPIIVRAPGLEPGRVDEYPVQHLDIAPTLLEAAGIDAPDSMAGDSLIDLDRESDAPVFFCVDGDDTEAVGIREGPWKYVEPEQGSPALYRVAHMGSEGEDVSDDHPEVHDRLVDALRDHEAELQSVDLGAGRASLSADRDDLSETVEQNLDQLGYIE
ncbi:sulfatase [Halococcoides cellulosivorans]|uniref:Sulfatase n=1 Tax=Halococcoides cellulosivorans TaxID=1679096 RepID=A0A2R4WXZ3_9EURY|nr:sulfatase [Halococcoides cellulosivorans]AWB26408.1 sulfatase [Halococcoides cellulosivorans]